MKIKMIVSIAGHAMPEYGVEDFAFNPGQILELDDRLAAIWIKGGHAVRYTGETASFGTEETATLDNKTAPKKRG